MKRIHWIVAGIAAAVVTSYATCYIAGECTCAIVGHCYGSVPLPDCQVPTCLIAETSATSLSVCAGPGTYTGRQVEYPPDPCCPDSCRAYDACIQQYIIMNGALCCFQVNHFMGVGSGCQ